MPTVIEDVQQQLFYQMPPQQLSAMPAAAGGHPMGMVGCYRVSPDFSTFYKLMFELRNFGIFWAFDWDKKFVFQMILSQFPSVLFRIISNKDF